MIPQGLIPSVMPSARSAGPERIPLFPWLRAKAWWEANRADGQPFSRLVSNYITQGQYLWSSPTEFILAAELCYQTPDQVDFQLAPNAWFIHLAATATGRRLDPGAFMRLAPHPHPWILFDRRGKCHVYRWDQFAGRQAPLPMKHG